MKWLHIADYLTMDEIEQRYRQASDPVARSQWQILWQLRCGRSSAEIAPPRVIHVPGCMPLSAATTVMVLLASATAATPIPVRLLYYHRHCVPNLMWPSRQPAPDGDVWTGPKVVAWVSDKLGRTVHPPRGWEMLQQIGCYSYVPHPCHAKTDASMQEEFKKCFLRQLHV